MSDIAALVAGNLDIWTSATQRKSSAGRGGGKRISLYGIERLRALILDLAVRGKLVPQDAGDEPASELLKRIEKIRTITFPKLKLAPFKGNTDLRPSIPVGWEVVRLDRLANSQAGFAFKSKGFNEVGAGLPLIRIRDVGQPFTGTFYSGEFREEFVVVEGDYLISMDGEFRVATWPGPNALLNQRVSRLQFYGEQTSQAFVAMALQLELTKLQGVKAYTTVDHLSGKQISEAAISLPPLAEQRRIVAKVDELMALCDALERESADAMAAHQALVEELLGTLVKSANAADLATNWARLETHFDTLFTTDTSIEALKQTILDLAVRGKLVEQDAGDETGGAFYKRIKEHKGLIQKSLRQRTEKFSQPLTDQSNNGEFPNGWFLTRFGEIMISRDAERVPISSEDRARRQGEYDYYGASGVIDKIDDFLFDKPLLLIGEDGANLINRSTPIAFIATGRYWVNNHAHVLDGISLGFLRYMELFINATDLKPYVTGTAQPKMNQAKMNSIEIALPPEAEQHRIVAKVDALMVLCDQLKTRLADAAQTQRHLADAITERAAA